ncbi:unnamed protein product [Rotaria socialis]|uniref:Uncharacterized protein n=1 Tax=Rotaria socialis TaxID=392032 RepID=A0A821KLZ9_9BILA|nr:unnamed protein product [Rotaria socialis]CAF3712645.1 unnamed protein product [Rotaria socialis]CAF4332979.1 unnamed protein product [Rotaria socialis]CAF4740148.1 unnamed protein product [Rotaria socialis]
MLYIQQYQHHRQDFLRQYQRRHTLAHQNFSLCSNEYNEKFPKISRPKTSSISYSHNETFVFLSGIASLEMKSTTENRQKTGLTRENKDSMKTAYRGSIPNYDKKMPMETTEKFSAVSRHQMSNNLNRLVKSTTIRNHIPNSAFLHPPILPEFDRPTTAPLMFEKNISRSVSELIKPSMPSSSSTPLRNTGSAESLDNHDDSRDSRYYQYTSGVFKNENRSVREPQMVRNSHMSDTNNSSNRNSFFYSSFDTNSPGKSTINNDDEPKTPYRSNQCRTNGFQHIANLGSWQRNTKNKPIVIVEKPREIQCDEETAEDSDHPPSNSSRTNYEYKSPFPEENDQAILLQTQSQAHISINEWNLKDFYRDSKTQVEPDTNTKLVFEKCLKLARMQAHTIKWEQRRRQNLIIYNRLLKNGSFDNNTINSHGVFPSKNNNEKDIRDINELKRELRCNECKRLACLGNCAPGNEYRQYKRYTPFSPLPSTREQIRNKLNLRTQRSTTDLRPCSVQHTIRETKFKFEPSNFNPIVVLPLYDNESQTKRPSKKSAHRYLPTKSLRSQRRETLALLATPKVST